MKDQDKFNVGENVTYVAYKGAAPEFSVVTSVRDNDDGSQSVWVRYTDFGSGQLTPINKLTKD